MTNLALVLSGGGSLGAIQVGCLEALAKAGIRPDLIVGTSIGALNGAIFATNPSVEGVEHIKSLWLSHTSTDLFGGAKLWVLLRAALGSTHIYSGYGLRQLLFATPGDTTFEELKVPLYVIATELETGRRTVFQSGPVLPTLLASSAMPGGLPSVIIGATEYVDGAVSSHCSLDVAFERGADSAILIHCPHVLTERGYGATRPFMRAMDIAFRRFCDLELSPYLEHPHTFILEPPVDPEILRLGEQASQTRLVNLAREWTEKYLTSKDGVKLLEHAKGTGAPSVRTAGKESALVTLQESAPDAVPIG